MEAPWYADGLNFECTQCGNCCSGEPGFVWVTDEEVAGIAGHLGIPVEEVKTLHSRLTWRGRTLREKASGECVFFERGQGCTVYPVRPVQCRTWPFWQTNLKNKQIWDEVSLDCPGMGQGNLIPVEQIIARMREFEL